MGMHFWKCPSVANKIADLMVVKICIYKMCHHVKMKRLRGQYQIKSRQNITYIFYFIRKALTWTSEEPGSRTRVFPRWAGDLGDLTGSACFSRDAVITVQGPALKHTQANLWAFVFTLYFNKLCSLRYTWTFITVLVSRVLIHMDSMCCIFQHVSVELRHKVCFRTGSQ